MLHHRCAGDYSVKIDAVMEHDRPRSPLGHVERMRPRPVALQGMVFSEFIRLMPRC